MSAGPENPYQTGAAMSVSGARQAFVILRGIVGAVIGGAIGYFVFRWLAKSGFYGMIIPGALLGLCAGLAARGQSITLGIIAAIAALVLSVIAEWSVFPFVRDGSLVYFVTHVHTLPAIKLIMIAMGVGLAYWLGQGR
jgi:hypothetical protein